MNALRLAGILLFVVGVFFIEAAHAENRRGITAQTAPIHVDPSPSAVVLGTYPKGSQVVVEFPDEGGWYKVMFSRPWKGKPFAWVRSNQVQLQTGGVSRAKSMSQTGAYARPAVTRKIQDSGQKGWIGLNYGFQSSSPTAFQTAQGEPAASLSSPLMGAEVGYSLSPMFKTSARVARFSKTVALTAEDVTGNYSYSAVLGDLCAYLQPVSEPLQILIGVGAGLAMGTVGNEISPAKIETSNIVVPTFTINASVRYPIGALALGLNAGYRILKFAAVPTSDGDADAVSPDVALSGLNYGFMAAFLF